MPIVKWIHISDIHIKTEGEHFAKYNSDVVLNALWRDIEKREALNPFLKTLDFAFITGDLAWSGTEYDQVYDRIISPLSQKLGIDISRIFLVPGNHDVSRSAINTDVNIIENGLTSKDEIIKILIDPSLSYNKTKIFARQKEYFDFIKRNLSHILISEEGFFSSHVDIAGENSIRIIGLNSSWKAHGGDEDRKNLVLGEPLVSTLSEMKANEVLTILLVHHPLKTNTDWFNDFERSTINQAVSGTDFILSGHVHSSEVASLMNAGGGYIEIVSGSIYDGRDWDSNSYNYVIFNTDASKGTCYLRRYDDKASEGPSFLKDLRITGDSKDGKISLLLIRDKSKEDNLFSAFLEKQERELNNRPLLSELYPAGEAISFLIPDLYVDPYVKPQKRRRASPIKLSEWVKDHFNYDMKILILGPPGIGKTTSLINFHHECKKNFINGTNNSVPFFYEARNFNWDRTLSIEDIVAYARARYGLSEEGEKYILDETLRPFALIDAFDEAFPNVYQKYEKLDLNIVDLKFPHVATSRSDFFERNLLDENFTKNYDEILIIEPWVIEREATQFLNKYFSKIYPEDDNNSKIEEIKKYLGISIPLDPLTVTAILFLWNEGNNSLETDPITSLGTLLERFSTFWAEREAKKSDSFRTGQELLHAFEIAAWQIYLNSGKSLTWEKVVKEIAKQLKKTKREILDDRGLLSMLRVTPERYPDVKETSVINSFSHEAIYEYFLSRKLLKALKGITTDEEILDCPMGHRINMLAREILESLKKEDRSELVKILQEKYYASLRVQDNPLKKFLRTILTKLGCEEYVKKKVFSEIIRRHTICYFWGRLEALEGDGVIVKLFNDLFNGSIKDHEIVITTVGSSMLFMREKDYEKRYLSAVAEGGSIDVCNRVYHLVYYGDAAYRSPDTFLEDIRMTWPKTKHAIIERLKKRDIRSQEIRSLDLVTFRRLCETMGMPELTEEEKEVINICAESLTLEAEKCSIVNHEHEKVLQTLSRI